MIEPVSPAKADVVAPRTVRRRRQPIQLRRQVARSQARKRIALGTRVPLEAAQLVRDPVAAPPRSAAARAARALASLVGSFGVHALVVLLGVVIGRAEFGRREVIEQPVKIEVRERPPEPPPPVVEEKPPEPEIAPTPPPVEPPKPKAVQPAEKPAPAKAPLPPAEEPKTPPPRIVGLSLESTTEGGEGPAFAVGNTREGTTAKKAADPNSVVPGARGPIAETAPAPTAPNRAATFIPSQGLVRTPPKPRVQNKPVYPPILKSQGIEGDVTMFLRIDRNGKVTEARVIKPSPYPEMDESARNAAMLYEYEPATLNGEPVETSLTFTTRFRLEDSE